MLGRWKRLRLLGRAVVARAARGTWCHVVSDSSGSHCYRFWYADVAVAGTSCMLFLPRCCGIKAPAQRTFPSPPLFSNARPGMLPSHASSAASAASSSAASAAALSAATAAAPAAPGALQSVPLLVEAPNLLYTLNRHLTQTALLVQPLPPPAAAQQAQQAADGAGKPAASASSISLGSLDAVLSTLDVPLPLPNTLAPPSEVRCGGGCGVHVVAYVSLCVYFLWCVGFRCGGWGRGMRG